MSRAHGQRWGEWVGVAVRRMWSLVIVVVVVGGLAGTGRALIQPVASEPLAPIDLAVFGSPPSTIHDWPLGGGEESRFFTMRASGTPGVHLQLRAGPRTSAPVGVDGSLQTVGVIVGPGVEGVDVVLVEPAPQSSVVHLEPQVSSVEPTRSAVVEGTRIVNVNDEPFVGAGYVYWPLEIGLQWPASTWANPTACQQDARMLGAAGVTLLRIPFEDHESAVHDRYLACLDAFHANGVSVLWLFGPPSQLEHIEDSPAFVDLYANKVLSAVEAVGDHPATAFWTIGNEIERSNPGELWLGNKTTGAPAMLEELIVRGKAADAGRHIWGTTICCPIIGPNGWLAKANVPSLDFWGLNAYHQPHAGGTWFGDISAADPRPKVITETGVDRYRCLPLLPVDVIIATCRTSYQQPSSHSGEEQSDQRTWNLHVWDNIAANLATPSRPDGALFGTTFFMWSDLWWFSLGFLLPSSTAVREVVGTYWSAPDGVINIEYHGVANAQPPGATEPRVTSMAFDGLASRWGSTPPPTMSNVGFSVDGDQITVQWQTSEPATSELQFGVNGEDGRDGGAMRSDNTIFRLGAYDPTLRTQHSLTVTAPTADPGVCQKLVPRSFTADGRSVTTSPLIAGCPSTARTGEA